MRALMAAVLLGCALLLAPQPAATAEPSTCPPACDRIPSAAWPDTWSLPLDPVYHWPALVNLAVPTPAPRFKFEELCASPPVPDDPRAYAVAARAIAGQPDGQWQLQAQIVHWRGDTWRAGQVATTVFDTAVAALRACQATAPLLSPSITTAEPHRAAAVLAGPVIVRQFLLVDPANSTIAELVFWRNAAGWPPGPAWPAMPDTQVLDAMSDPLCRAYLGSCG